MHLLKGYPGLKGSCHHITWIPFFLGGQSYDLDPIITMKKKDSTVKQLTQRKTSYKKPALSTSLLYHVLCHTQKAPVVFFFIICNNASYILQHILQPQR